MLNRILAVVLIGCLVAAAAEAATRVPSEVKAVTVFTDRALVTREAETEVAAGLNTLWIEVAAFRVDPDAVSARVFGAGEMVAVQYKTIPLEESAREDIRLLEDKLRVLTRQHKALDDRQTTLQKQQRFLDAFIDFAEVQVPEDIRTRLPQPDEMARTLDFLGQHYQSLQDRHRRAAEEVEQLGRQMEVVRRELDQLRGPRANTLRIIEVLFASKRDQGLRLEADYLVRSVRWQPLYKAVVPADLSGVDLTLFARIFQKSGEDWTDVDLTVSNAVPLSGARLPTLESWPMDLPRPVPLQRRAKAAVAADAVMETEAMVMRSEAPRPAGFAQATRRPSALAFEYGLGRSVTIASRDQETLLPLFTRRLSGAFVHWAVPKRQARVFMTCQAQADSELLAGPLNVHFDGQYVGKTILAEKHAGGQFQLNLGADRGVLVKREKRKDQRRETYFGGFSRDTVVRELAYRITLENLKATPVKIQLLDHIPVSRTDRIKIDDVGLDPAPQEKDHEGREGVMRWELTLAPGQKRMIDITFVIGYPKNFEPPGL